MNRELIIKAARQLLATNPVILDTETTGLGNDAEIVEIAMIDSDGVVLLNSLVKPVNPIPAEATAIHGITNDMVTNAPDLFQLFKDIADAVEGRAVLIYNAAYDLRLLAQSLNQRVKATHPGYQYLCKPQINTLMQQLHTNRACIMELYAEYNGEWDNYRNQYKWQKLTNAAKHFNAARPDAHRALADCLMTLDVVKGIAGCQV